MIEVMYLHALICLHIQRGKSCPKQKHKNIDKVNLIKIVDFIDQDYIGI